MAAGDEVQEMPTVRTLDELCELIERHGQLYVRYSRGPEKDGHGRSVDDESGHTLPGLSANGLAPEDWWSGSTRAWVARQVLDYSHLLSEDGCRAWALEAREVGRGPDNEPLVEMVRPVAWIDTAVIREAETARPTPAREGGPAERPAKPRSS